MASANSLNTFTHAFRSEVQLLECAMATGSPAGVVTISISLYGFEEGRPLFVRSPGSKFTLANFMRNNLYTCLGAMRVGLDILLNQEHVKIDKLLGHGGLFKTKGVGQQILADAVNAPVSVMSTAGEGGAWGIALLASYLINKKDGEDLADFLDENVFKGNEGSTLAPEAEGVKGFNAFMDRYMKGLGIERAAVESEIW